MLTNELEAKYTKQKVILFFDELPWMVTKRSKLMQELDHYWNTAWSKLANLKVILCGSAASWMLDKLINAKGGLHNRLTHHMLLKPFDLNTTKTFINSIGCKLSLKQITELYMVTGGIPFYLKSLQKNLSLSQNINHLCFHSNGILYDEFHRLFESLFSQAEINLRIVRAISKQRHGISRERLLSTLKMTSGGSFNKRMKELEAAGFIRTFIPYGRQTRDSFYRLIDEFCLFYLTWIEPARRSGHEIVKNYWQSKQNTSTWHSWSGYAFESICMKHTEQIRAALDLQQIGCDVASWKYLPKHGDKADGAQIDLLFDRDDDAITLFEIKFTKNLYVIDKAYAKQLINKMEVFEKQTKTQKQLFQAMITTQGIKPNVWSEDLIHYTVTINDLFIN